MVPSKARHAIFKFMFLLFLLFYFNKNPLMNSEKKNPEETNIYSTRLTNWSMIQKANIFGFIHVKTACIFNKTF